jgi:uncharacterized hydrophobic protein (TIGR00271 family)
MNDLKFLKRIIEYFNLESELDDFDRIHETILKDIVFKGTNLWILMFAIIVASVGLNMNSTAVIIGAMLISPLMGPINGMGYSIATYNFPLLRKSIKNYTFAVLVSLVASMTYFTLSPISTAHSELLARTTPSIYDVLIALFGGLAGIVAITSRQKGNVIPGVAIATALMPPLCTAGYGLATAQFYYFFRAIYLFTINTVFIALSSVAVSQILKFPIRTIVEESQKKKVNRWISTVITLIFIPSVYFGYGLVQRERFVENANKYIKNISVVEGNFLLKHEIDAVNKSINLVYGGRSMAKEQKAHIIEKAKDFSLAHANINFQQGLAIDELDRRNSELENLKAELNHLSLVIKDKDVQLDSIYNIRFIGGQILDEIKAMYPDIESCLYAKAFEANDTITTTPHLVIVIFTVNGKSTIKASDKLKIENWLKARQKTDRVKVLFEYN